MLKHTFSDKYSQKLAVRQENPCQPIQLRCWRNIAWLMKKARAKEAEMKIVGVDLHAKQQSIAMLDRRIDRAQSCRAKKYFAALTGAGDTKVAFTTLHQSKTQSAIAVVRATTKAYPRTGSTSGRASAAKTASR